MGHTLDRSLPSHLAADAHSLLGTDFVFRVPVRHPHPRSGRGRGQGGGENGKDDEEKLLVTVLVKKAVRPQPPTTTTTTTAAAKTGRGKENEEDDPPLILLLHGFPDDASTFHAQILPFATAGFDVVVPVMPGYEPSTALLPPESYTLPSLALMLENVVEWAVTTSFVHADEDGEEEKGNTAVKEEKENEQRKCKLRKGGRKIHVLGHDWGAALAYLLSAEGSTSVGRIASIATLAVPHNPLPAFLAHPGQFVRSWYMIFMQLPFLPEYWFRLGGRFAGLHKLWRDWSPGYVLPPSLLASLHTTFSEPGVLVSAMQYYRANVPPMLQRLVRGKVEGWAGGEGGTEGGFVVGVPTLGLVGKEDGCIASVLFDVAMGSVEGGGRHHPLFSKAVQVAKVEGGGHFVHQERPKEVNALVLAWFERFGENGTEEKSRKGGGEGEIVTENADR